MFVPEIVNSINEVAKPV